MLNGKKGHVQVYLGKHHIKPCVLKMSLIPFHARYNTSNMSNIEVRKKYSFMHYKTQMNTQRKSNITQVKTWWLAWGSYIWTQNDFDRKLA